MLATVFIDSFATIATPSLADVTTFTSQRIKSVKAIAAPKFDHIYLSKLRTKKRKPEFPLALRVV